MLHASEIAGNSIALLVEMQRNLKYNSMRPAARGMHPSMNSLNETTLYIRFKTIAEILNNLFQLSKPDLI